ncbi:MAG: thioredoxin family protein [Clostridia bacterium]
MGRIDKKKLLKILVPAAILILIAGVWVLKNIDFTRSDNLKGAVLVTPVKEEHFELDAKTLDIDVLLEYNMPIILDFGSDSCLPCISFYPTLKAMHSEMYGKVIIKYLDVYMLGEEIQGYPVSVIPTQIFINADGTPYMPNRNIDIEFTIYNYNSTGEHAFTAHEGVLSQKQLLAIIEDMGEGK